MPTLCLVVDDKYFSDLLSLKKMIVSAVDGGVNLIILRSKILDWESIKLFTNSLKEDLKDEIPIGINVGNLKIFEPHSDVLHFPEYSILKEKDYSQVVGRSVHSLKAAIKAESCGADYLIAGTIYSTDSHPYKKPEGLSLIKSISSNVSIPVFAIGGMKPKNIIPVLESGASGISTISSILSSDEPKKIAQSFYKILIENYNPTAL